MNFVYIHTHDSGRQMQPYGVSANNPALMELAEEGIIFRQMHCAAPTCSPSRAGMLTGMSPHCCGMLGLAHRGFSLRDYRRHLASYLREHGFYTALFGVQHECPDRQDASLIGYSEWHFQKGKTNFETDRNHLEQAKSFLSRAGELSSPFFLSFGMRNTHRKWSHCENPKPEYVLPPYLVADTPENRLEYCDYLESLSQADDCVGEIIAALKQNRLWENTAVLFTTDHGIAYPNMKCNLYDTGTGVAFILRIPGKGHSVCDALCSQLDLFPTVCDLLELPKPDWLQGVSMLPLLNGERKEIHDFIFSEITFHATYEPSRSVRSKHYKLIRFFDGGELPKMPNICAGIAKDLYAKTPLSREPRPKELFFDLIADPCERLNLAEDPHYREPYLLHAAALDAWMRRTEDPLLGGTDLMRVIGKGSRINPLDGYDPGPASVYVISG